jgi:hypothetical protein
VVSGGLSSVVFAWAVAAATGASVAATAMGAGVVGTASAVLWVTALVLTCPRRARAMSSRRVRVALRILLLAVPACLALSIVMAFSTLIATDTSYWPM